MSEDIKISTRWRPEHGGRRYSAEAIEAGNGNVLTRVSIFLPPQTETEFKRRWGDAGLKAIEEEVQANLRHLVERLRSPGGTTEPPAPPVGETGVVGDH